MTFANISKAKLEIGYSPEFDLETGIENFVTWYLTHKDKLYFDKQ